MKRFINRFINRMWESDFFILLNLAALVTLVSGAVWVFSIADNALTRWHRDELCAQGVEQYCPGYMTITAADITRGENE